MSLSSVVTDRTVIIYYFTVWFILTEEWPFEAALEFLFGVPTKLKKKIASPLFIKTNPKITISFHVFFDRDTLQERFYSAQLSFASA